MVEQAKRKAGRPKIEVVDLRSSNPEVTLISVPEAAWLLRWDVTTVRRKILNGSIPATTNPRSPQSLEEANGLVGFKPNSKNRYRIQKTFIAQRMYGSFIAGEIQPMSEQEMTVALERLNAALREYERTQGNYDGSDKG